jgi:hypothetical protein
MAGIAPTYRIGPAPDVFTSDDLAADANTLNSQINELDDADWSKPPQDLFDGWNSFVDEWRGFYRSTFFNFFGAAWNDSNRDQLIQFETRFGTFAEQYKAASGNQLPGGVIAPSTGNKDTLGNQLLNQLQPLIPSINVRTIAIVGGLAAAALAVIYFRAPLGRALKTGAA